MVRTVRILLMIAGLMIAAVAATAAYLLWTPPGRAALKGLVETRLGAALGGEAKIGALEGDLPATIRLSDVRLSAKQEMWLQVSRLEIRWRPFALLRGRIEIDAIALTGATLLGTPSGEEKDEQARPRGFVFPDRLPSLAIGELSLTDIRLAPEIAGADVRLDGAGSLRMGGRALNVFLAATSSGERDYVLVRVDRDGQSLHADATIASGEDGAIAALARLGGPVYFEAKGDGPLARYRLSVNAALGAYGALEGVVGGDLERMERIEIDATAALGPRLSEVARIVGDKASLQGAFAPADDGGELVIASFRSDIGAIEGDLRWRNREDALDIVEANLAASLAEDWRPDIRRYVGDFVRLNGDVRPLGDTYKASGLIDAGAFSARLDDVETDLRSYARGPASLRLAADIGLPADLGPGTEASGNFDFRFDEGVTATSMKLRTAAGGEFGGDASYSFAEEKFALKGNVVAPPAFVALLAPDLRIARQASAVVDVGGAIDRFGGRIVATIPPAAISNRPLPASRIALAFADAPTAATGEISLRAIDGSLRLGANFMRGEGDLWRFSRLDYVGEKFALKGSGSYGPEGGAIDIAYRGVEDAEPWPGVPLIGEFTAKGSISRLAAMNELAIEASALASKGWSIRALSAKFEGPPERIVASASAGEVNVSGAAPFTDIALALTLRADDPRRLRLTKLDADVGGAPVRLTAPAALDFTDGVSVDGLRADFGGRGALAADGALTKSRWRAVVSATRAPIISTASVIDFDLDLDTNRPDPARGAFALTSMITKTESASLAGRFAWDGRRLSIVDDGENEALDLDLSLPARLTKSPAIRISTDGAIAGSARYAGRIETLAGLLPSALQSLEGALAFESRASGTLADPRLDGSLAVTDGAFTEIASGLSIVGIEADARASGALDGSRIAFDATGRGVGQDKKTMAARGTLILGKEGRLDSKISLNNARFSAGPVDEVVASGEVDLSGPLASLLAEGTISVHNLDARVVTPEKTGLVNIDVVALNGAEGAPAEISSATAPAPLAFRIAIKGDDRIFVRGRGLTSEWRADAQFVGKGDAPMVLGNLTLKNGEIAFAGRRFEISRGSVAFDRLSTNDPALDLRAERETRSGTTAAIVIAGRASAPKISLESTPPLPTEDIMALVLFDKPASELSAFESLQVAEGLASLGGIGPFGGEGVTGSARQALGLDVLSVDIDEADGAGSTLTVGKYVAEGLFVSATQDARGENGSVRIEYEIDTSFTVETELRQDGDQTVSANWKHDF